MRKILLAISLMLAASVFIAAQKANNRISSTTNSETKAQTQSPQFDFQSATLLTAQLENSLDARKAKVGDRVVLKIARDLKQNGQTVIRKGARLIGQVTEVQQQTKVSGESRIGLVFDRLRSGSTDIPITASILSITQARSRSQAGNAGLETETMSQTSTSTRSSSSGGGLLGGVTNTTSGVLNTTTTTAGNVVGGTTNAVGSTVGTTTRTTGNVAGSLSSLRISESGSASAEGGSTLSLTGGNLRLESGATFNLAVRNSNSAGSAP